LSPQSPYKPVNHKVYQEYGRGKNKLYFTGKPGWIE
jgi:hypothetical protein